MALDLPIIVSPTSPVEEHKEEEKPKPKPVTVGVSLKVVRMLDIDPVEQTFKCDMFIKYEWLDPKLKGVPKDEVPAADDVEGWKKYWDPKLTFRNMIEMDEIRFPKKVHDVATGKLESEFFVVATFFQAYDLHLFPFDRHKLTFEVRSSDYGADKVLLTQHSKRDSVLEAFSLPAWSLERTPQKRVDTVTKRPPGTASGQEYSYYYWTVETARHYSAYLWNIGFLLFLISTLAVVTFFLETYDVGSRSSTMLTLVLTAVALKFVVNDNLPKISYLTILDYYIFLCFFVLYILTILTTAATHFKGLEASQWNQWFCQGFLIIWLVIHLVLFLLVMCAYRAPDISTKEEPEYGCCCRTNRKDRPRCCVATPLQIACCLANPDPAKPDEPVRYKCAIPRLEPLTISLVCTALVLAVVTNSDLAI